MKQHYSLTNKRDSQAGFTLIELSLALTFLAFIMLFIITIIMQMINIYNKSVSLSQINQTGRQIMSDLNNGARFAAPLTAGNYVPIQVVNGQAVGGRLCSGGTSYIWNTGNLVSGTADTSVANIFSSESFTSGQRYKTALRLVRVDNDPSGTYCVNTSATGTPQYKMPSRSDANTIAIVGTGIAVQNFSVIQNGQLLQVNVILSTAGNNVPSGTVTATSNTLKCMTNSFCAFATYNFVIYQRGGR